MWPFTKKEINFIPSKEYFFTPFKNIAIDWKQLFKDNQNNSLLLSYFNDIAEVQAPILKFADAATLVKIKSNVPEVEKLLSKPNPFQNYGEYISQFIIYKRLMGNSIVNAFSPLTADGKKPIHLFNLSPEFVKIQTSKDKDFRFNTIELYIFDSGDARKNKLEIDPEYILHVKESNPNFSNDQYLFGLSRYASCYRNIETLSNGYDAKKNIYKNGPRLAITGKAQGDFASVNTEDDLRGVQERYKKYGMREQDYNAFITDMPLDVKVISFNVQDLQITEMNASDFQRLCDAQTIDSRCFSDLKGSTFTNKEAALNDFYNNSFRSEMDSITKDHEAFLKKWWPNLELTNDYSAISYINKNDELVYASLFEEVKLGLMTRNDYFEKIGKERIKLPEFDQYFFWSNGWFPVKNQNINTDGTNI